MRIILLFLACSFAVNMALCQVEEEVEILGPNIIYIPADSLFNIDINEEVKLDFKTHIKGQLSSPSAFPSLRGARQVGAGGLWYGDTINLVFQNEDIEFVEVKGKTIDWYLFMLERLESRAYKKDHILIIPYAKIKAIENDSLRLEMALELYKEKEWELVDSSRSHLQVPLSDLDGVLIKPRREE